MSVLELPAQKYPVLLSDPPWGYSAWSNKGSRTSDAHYPTMTIEEVKGLPVYDTLEENAAVFMWATSPMFDTQVEVLRAWGLRYVTVAFTWVKLGRKPLSWERAQEVRADGDPVTYYGSGLYKLHFGLGHYTRANAEFCLLALKGKMPVSSKSIQQVILAPLREHSRKPDEQWSRIDELYPQGPKLEMFARPSTARPAEWDVWGLEAET